jgi:hypothetical protein
MGNPRGPPVQSPEAFGAGAKTALKLSSCVYISFSYLHRVFVSNETSTPSYPLPNNARWLSRSN